MPSRREILLSMTAGLVGPTVASVREALALGLAGAPWHAQSQSSSQSPSPSAKPAVAPHGEIKTALPGVVGLQLWSLRKSLPTSMRATMMTVQGLGFHNVEAAGLWKHTVAEQRNALKAAGLRCYSAHVPFERLRDDRAGAFAEVKALGARWVVCPWIPHKDDAFTREDMLKAAETFNAVGKAAAEADLRFAYHCHGYEFIPATEGTLFDTLAKNTDETAVTFQIDVFHALLGGADPVALIQKFDRRVTSLHLKDLKKGFPRKAGTATAPAESDVPLGTGQVNMPAVLHAAIKAGTQQFYIEDESDEPLGHIPQSVAFLEAFKP